MTYLNAALRAVFDLLLSPFRTFHPLVGLAVVSALVTVGILYVLKWTSNQGKIDAVKRQIQAGIFEMRLFNDDLRAILRAQGGILANNARYLGLWLVPLLWLAIPVLLTIAHLQPFFGYRGLEPGQSAILTAELRSDAEPSPDTPKPDVRLEAPPGLRVETPGVWVATRNEISWRINASAPGQYEVKLVTGEETVAKSVVSSPFLVRRSPNRAAGFWHQVLWPSESPLRPAGRLERVTVSYPEDVELLGAPRWVWIFLLFTLVFAVALRRPLGVTF